MTTTKLNEAEQAAIYAVIPVDNLHDEEMLYAAVEEILAAREPEVRAEALVEAAGMFDRDAARAWGGPAPWLTTGEHAASLAGEWLRGHADDIREAAASQEGTS